MAKTESVYLFTLISLTIALILVSFLLAGCTSSTPGIRKFYLLSLRYNPSFNSSLVTDLDALLDGDRGLNGTFSDVRIGYRGICIETRADANATEADWACGRRTPDVFTDLSGDPIDLLKVADTYKDRISFSAPLWAATLALGLATLLVILNSLPALPLPAVTRKIAAAAASVGTLLLLGCMILQQVTSSAVENLVTQLSVGAVDIGIGSANVAFGWGAFACAVLAAVGTAAAAAADAAVLGAQERAQDAAAAGLEKASGGRVGLNDFRPFSNSAAPPPSAAGSAKTATNPKKKLAMKGVSLAGGILQNKFNARK